MAGRVVNIWTPRPTSTSPPDKEFGILLGLKEVVPLVVSRDMIAGSLAGLSFTTVIEETARWAHAVFRAADGNGLSGTPLTAEAAQGLRRRTGAPFDLSPPDKARLAHLLQERGRQLVSRPSLALLRGFLAQLDAGDFLTRGRGELDLDERAILLKTLLWLHDQHVRVPDDKGDGLHARNLDRLLAWQQIQGQPATWDNPLESLGRLDWWIEHIRHAPPAYQRAVGAALRGWYGVDDVDTVVLTFFGLLIAATTVDMGSVPRVHRRDFISNMTETAARAVCTVLDKLTTTEEERKVALRRIWTAKKADSLFFRPDLAHYCLRKPLLEAGEHLVLVDTGCIRDTLGLLTKQIGAPASDTLVGKKALAAAAGPLHERYVGWLFEGDEIRVHHWPKQAGSEKFDVLIEDGTSALALQCKRFVRSIEQLEGEDDTTTWNRHGGHVKKAAKQIAETIRWWHETHRWPETLPPRESFRRMAFAVVADGLPLGSTSILTALDQYKKRKWLRRYPPVLALRDIEALASLSNLGEVVRLVSEANVRPGSIFSSLLRSGAFCFNEKLKDRGDARAENLSRYFTDDG